MHASFSNNPSVILTDDASSCRGKYILQDVAKALIYLHKCDLVHLVGPSLSCLLLPIFCRQHPQPQLGKLTFGNFSTGHLVLLRVVNTLLCSCTLDGL